MAMDVGGKPTKKSGGIDKPVSAIEKNRAMVRESAPKNGSIVFQRIDGKQGTQIIGGRCIATEKGSKIALRYIPGVKQIEEDRQGNLAGLKPRAIVMREGKIVTEDKTLIEFLNRHPGNRDNGGTLFYEYNADKAAQQLLNEDLLRDEARFMASKGLSEAQVYALCKAIKTPSIEQLSEAQLRVDLRTFAGNNPRVFLDLIESPEPEVLAALSIAFAEGKVSLSDDGHKFMWSGGSIITNLPNLDPNARMDYLVRWMLTDKTGADILEVLRA